MSHHQASPLAKGTSAHSAAAANAVASLAGQGGTAGHGRCHCHILAAPKGLGSTSEQPSHAPGAVLGQDTAAPSVCITAPWGQTGLVCVPCGGLRSHLLPPALELQWQEGTGERWLWSHGVPSFPPQQRVPSRGPPQRSGSPNLGPSPGQTLWGAAKLGLSGGGNVGLCLPGPTAGTPFSAAPWVWQCRRDRNWSCKSSSSGGAPVATAALHGQEGAQELLCNGEVQAVSSYEMANGERQENKALQQGRKEKAGERKGGEGAKQRREILWKREMELRSLQLWLITAPRAWCLAVAWQCPPGLAALLFLAGCSPSKPSFPQP